MSASNFTGGGARMPRLAIAVVVAALIFPGGLVWAEVSDEPWPPTKARTEETVYATDHHMGFSLRSAFIDWLGGIAIVDEADLRAAQQERWWGDTVPLVPAEVVGSER
jgi:hypothetical protein